MATTEYDFQTGRSGIVARALRIVGAIGPFQQVAGEQSAAAVTALNQLVKSWQKLGIFLWQQVQFEITLIVGTKTYLLTNDPFIVWIDRAFYRTGTGTDDEYELEVLPFRDYAGIPDKTSSGTPTCISLDGQAQPTAYVWPVPNATKKIFCQGIKRLKDWDSPTGSADFPPEWDLALTWNLAKELAPEYQVKAEKLLYIRGEAQSAFNKARGGEVERESQTFVRSAFSRSR